MIEAWWHRLRWPPTTRNAVRRLKIVQADPNRLTVGQPPILIDEWQRFPGSWDRTVRKERGGRGT